MFILNVTLIHRKPFWYNEVDDSNKWCPFRNRRFCPTVQEISQLLSLDSLQCFMSRTEYHCGRAAVCARSPPCGRFASRHTTCPLPPGSVELSIPRQTDVGGGLADSLWRLGCGRCGLPAGGAKGEARVGSLPPSDGGLGLHIHSCCCCRTPLKPSRT